MFDGIGLVASSLWTKVVIIVYGFPNLLFIIHNRNVKPNVALLSLHPQNTEFDLQGLIIILATLSGDNSAMKHFRPVLGVSSSSTDRVGASSTKKTNTEIDWSKAIFYFLYYKRIMKLANLKLTVTIHKVRLNVRFPCAVTANLKIGIAVQIQNLRKYLMDRKYLWEWGRLFWKWG